MNSCSAIYCISAISQNNVRLSDIFQITTLILIMCIVFLHWTIRTLNRTAVHDKFSWFPVWCHCMSLIQFQPEALANTVVQCKPFKHRSDWATPRPGPQAEDHASTLLPLLCSPLCFQENQILHPGTVLAMEICHDTLCNTGESPTVLLLCFHCTLTGKPGPNEEWLLFKAVLRI